MMIHSTAPGDTLRIDIDVDEGGAEKRWLIEKASKVRIESGKRMRRWSLTDTGRISWNG